MQESPSRSQRAAREIAHGDKIADAAEAIWNWASPAGRRRARRRGALLCEALGPSVSALELGCGSGVFLEQAATTGADIVALDISATLLTAARTRLRESPRLSFCCGNAELLPFPADHFDVVYGSSVLHHLQLKTALPELRRVLRPGGRLVFTEPNLLNPHVAVLFTLLPRSRFGVSPDEMAFTRFAARRALEAAGFAEIAVRPFDFLHPAVPGSLADPVERLGARLERLPLLREIAGSLVMSARKPKPPQA